MTCPRCSLELERKIVRGRTTEIDRCAKCGGIWFDDGEIGEIIGAGPGRINVPAAARMNEKESCPRCRKPLHAFAYPGTMTIVEGCRSCAGLWLDAGELEEIRKTQSTSRMECPRCGAEQPRAEACAQCGVVISKAAVPVRREPARPGQPPPPLHGEIPGVKGSIIRFIDTALSRLMDGIKGS